MPRVAEGNLFAGDWLALRELVDHCSRAHGLAGQVRHYISRRHGSPLIIDLGAGSGSNLRYLAPRMGCKARWRLLDQDESLLAVARESSPASLYIETRVADLAAPLADELAGADLVTASALLDLTSAAWINALCRACAKAGAAVLMALTIDGQIRFSHADPMDKAIRHALICDQRRDKGLGPALGSGAVPVLVNALARYGYAITVQPSHWYLDYRHGELAAALIAGWCEAARRQRPDIGGAISDWGERKITAVTSGREQIMVGHADVLGLPEQRCDKSRS